MASKKQVLEVLGAGLDVIDLGKKDEGIHVKSTNPQKTYDYLNIDETQATNDTKVLSGQILDYVWRSSIGDKVKNIIMTHDNEANRKLEKETGMKVVFPDKK